MLGLENLPLEWRLFICKCTDGHSPGPKLKAIPVGSHKTPITGHEVTSMIMLLCSACDKPRIWLLHICGACGEYFLKDFRHPAACYSAECLIPCCYSCLEEIYPDRVCECNGPKITMMRAAGEKIEPYLKHIADKVKALSSHSASEGSVFSF